MKVSIIVPVYNVEQYIERCILSVVHQTYTGQMECILVDDRGTDKSIAIVEQFIASYDGSIDFRILHHTCNRGLSAARNTGTDAATGDYIFYLDSDDELPKDSIQILATQVTLHPSIQCVQGYTVSIPAKECYDTKCFLGYSYVTDNNWIRSGYYTAGKTIPVNAWNKLLNVDFLRRNKLYFKEGIIHEDEHWMWFLVKKLQSLVFVFDPTYIHYYTSNSIMSGLTHEKSAKFWGEILSDWIYYVDEISYREQLIKILTIYSKKEINKYMKENYFEFWGNVEKVLLKYGLYKAYLLLFLWKITYSCKNIRKLYRFTIESIEK